MNIRLTLCFDGTAYCGFQVQNNGVSVCETVQNALEAVLGTRPPVKGCSRTDGCLWRSTPTCPGTYG